MSAVILKIGNVDLSGITKQEGVRIRSSPVFGAEFTNVKGVKRRQVIGEWIDLSADFDLLPEATAAAVVAACSADTVTVQYKNPNNTVTVFERPSVESVPVFAESEEDDANSYWNLSLSMTRPLKGDGL